MNSVETDRGLTRHITAYAEEGSTGDVYMKVPESRLHARWVGKGAPDTLRLLLLLFRANHVESRPAKFNLRCTVNGNQNPQYFRVETDYRGVYSTVERKVYDMLTGASIQVEHVEAIEWPRNLQ